MTSRTTQETRDTPRPEHQSLNQPVLPPKTEKPTQPEFIFCESPIEGLQHVISCNIEAAAKTGEHGVFGEGKNLLDEGNTKHKIFTLPKGGCHDDTPFNMHLTGPFSLKSEESWLLAQFHREEGIMNVGRRRSSHFITQYNMNSFFNLDVDFPQVEPISLLEHASLVNFRGYRPISDFTTTDFRGVGANGLYPLLNMNHIFAADE